MVLPRVSFTGYKFRVFFNASWAVALLFLFYNQRSPVIRNSPLVQRRSKVAIFYNRQNVVGMVRRRVEEISVQFFNDTGNPPVYTKSTASATEICTGLFEHKGYGSRCEYLAAHSQCTSGGFFNYIEFFYCDCKNFSFLGFAVMVAWLGALFYLLGNTAADYFCCSLEKLASLWKLPATVAGVTLLPLGNGAPDVFASIAAFVSKDAGDVGLNSVLGGAVFVTCVVVGAVSIAVANGEIQIDRKCFIRDISFFLLTLTALAIILAVGEISIGSAVAFISIYLVYAFVVAVDELLRKYAVKWKLHTKAPLLPVGGSLFPHASEEDKSLHESLFEPGPDSEVPHLPSKFPQCMWASNVAIYSTYSVKDSEDGPMFFWGWKNEEPKKNYSSLACFKTLSLLEMPLTIPRRLTIPLVEKEQWSKGYAVASASLAPILLAFVWSTQDDVSSFSIGAAYIAAVALGGSLGILAYLYTNSDQPPDRFQFPWVFGGFLMSIVWFYIIANELVALLVAFGFILEINPSILGLTVLAWGNSMGDLVSNIALALNGQNGVQIAMSGCYACPMFNTLAGLGISMLLGSWSTSPAPYLVPKDSSLFMTMGFLVLGLIWSLVVLPKNGMRLNKTLGIGLITIYLVFLAIKISIFLSAASPVGLD